MPATIPGQSDPASGSADGDWEIRHIVKASLVRMGLLHRDENPSIRRLGGGVSSDIFCVDLEEGPVCVKRALPRLRVSAEWRAPVERNRFEQAWLALVAEIRPDAAPELLGVDAEQGLFAMRYLDDETHTSLKALLKRGVARLDTAREVGARMGEIHGATAGNALVASRFASDSIFEAIRIEPYLLATAKVHPKLGKRLTTLASETLANRIALVHGDVSPKNIMVGPLGPVFLDAECAWYGDPAFDLAFCLNHYLLKCLLRPATGDEFLACFDALTEAYLERVDWESQAALEARAAALLPALLLARVDGKSPVEYLQAEDERKKVRRVASKLLRSPAERLAEIRQRWVGALQS